MKDSSIIKIASFRRYDDYPAINKIIGSIDANNFAKLIDIAGLDANPRESKSNKVTDAITDTLEKSPELMIFKSKGLLVSTSKCTVTDSYQHVKLSFNKQHEGVLDGGHNMFAITLFILAAALGASSFVLFDWSLAFWVALPSYWGFLCVRQA